MAEPISCGDLDNWRRQADGPGSVHLPKSVLRRIIARLDKAEVQASEAKAALWRIGPTVHTVYADEYRRIAFERDALRAEVERHRSEPLIKSIERILDEHSAWIARPSPEVTKAIALAAGIAGTEANRQAASEYERHLEAEVERLRAVPKEAVERAAWVICARGGGGWTHADKYFITTARAVIEALGLEVEDE